jgi:hypothetical protein
VGLGAVLNEPGRSLPHRDPNPGPSSLYPVAISTKPLGPPKPNVRNILIILSSLVKLHRKLRPLTRGFCSTQSLNLVL